MSQDYTPMWESLGMDLNAHDALLGVLEQGYRDIYLTQKNRPEGMGYFDFVLKPIMAWRMWGSLRPGWKLLSNKSPTKEK